MTHMPTGSLMESVPRLYACPVSRICCTSSGQAVGYLYEWNNGDRQAAWFGKPVRDVRYEPIVADELAEAGT